jgi:hypothetical protein
LRQARNAGALRETHRQVDQELDAPAGPEQPAFRRSRNDAAEQETQRGVDEENSRAAQEAHHPSVLRTWTHRGGMVEQQASANRWVRQNQEIRARMAANDSPGSGREGEGAQSRQSGQEQDRAELEEARAAVEEARRREAGERARQQERERSGPER